MKSKSMFTAFILKALLVITCTILGFAGVTKCDAQSIVGKWKGVSTKDYFDVESIKKSNGKEFMESSMEDGIMSLIVEYKPDGTYITTISMMNKINKSGGRWTLTGDQLKTEVDPKYNPMKGQESNTLTVVINGNKMLATAVFVKNNSPVKGIIKSETTFTRM